MRQPDNKLRLGMVGGGEGAFIGAVHRAAANLDGRIRLVCGNFSREPDNNQRTGASLGLTANRVYPDWPSMIRAEAALPESERMQALSIVTPNQLHVPITEAALDAGFHVFCEKPAGITLAEVTRLQRRLAASDRHYGLAHTYLGYPLVHQARHMVRNGKLGQIRKIYADYRQGWLAGGLEYSGNKQAGWRTDPSQAGASGCMADIGTHTFGLAEFVSGHKITRLCAELHSHIDGRQLDDDGSALFRTDGGASGVLTASQVCAGEENDLTLRIYGEHGGLEWHQMQPDTLVHRRANGDIHLLRAGTDREYLLPTTRHSLRLPAGHPEGYLEAMANLYRDFASAILDGTPCAIPGIDNGLRGMAFIDAMLRSGGHWTELEIPSTEPHTTGVKA
ncbi:Gfo/Idh/MocA family oxidoreductase [Microbulbifer bruguierae]|uniref:Gfo/Idh/MocA family oxidoreductase n=1 Tax=Microbulbifer bruguierae TaxID=3029061 RepID=A0ABY8NIX9_9GAMM|nr:Gfo/Idh/MocA family oxidoreductase [Microbulbifer bruguierae]WGL18394.1 Gfo/Idh/MocA family oxidoreductase [Microbulbifer bruguierae]